MAWQGVLALTPQWAVGLPGRSWRCRRGYRGVGGRDTLAVLGGVGPAQLEGAGLSCPGGVCRVILYVLIICWGTQNPQLPIKVVLFLLTDPCIVKLQVLKPERGRQRGFLVPQAPP